MLFRILVRGNSNRGGTSGKPLRFLARFQFLHFFFLPGALCLLAGHHLRLTRGPAGNRTTNGSLSASSRTMTYTLSISSPGTMSSWAIDLAMRCSAAGSISVGAGCANWTAGDNDNVVQEN